MDCQVSTISLNPLRFGVVVNTEGKRTLRAIKSLNPLRFGVVVNTLLEIAIKAAGGS